MLPAQVRALSVLLKAGREPRRVYVHCTAGINRASLATVGYLTWLEGWQLDDALNHVRLSRPQAHPYVDCWRTARHRLIEGRGAELKGISKVLYEKRVAAGGQGGGDSDWFAAEAQLIRETFERRRDADLSIIDSVAAVQGALRGAVSAVSPGGAQSVVAQERINKLEAAAAAAEARAAAAEADRAALQARAIAGEARAAQLQAQLEARGSLKHDSAEAAQTAGLATGPRSTAASLDLQILQAATKENVRMREEVERFRRRSVGLAREIEELRGRSGHASPSSAR